MDSYASAAAGTRPHVLKACSLLIRNLTNWTYSNRTMRFTVTIGVAYKSDPRRVIQLLNEVAERHRLVDKEPKPQVIFTEFGESTLAFELRFRMDVTKANAAQVSSDLRLMIVSSFAEHGIVNRFPAAEHPPRFQLAPSNEHHSDLSS